MVSRNLGVKAGQFAAAVWYTWESVARALDWVSGQRVSGVCWVTPDL